MLSDITDRKRMEQQIRASLQEKEVLLKEVHHRVKNNLQVICSLLDLQAHYLTDADARRLFEESRDRIRSIALAHEKLFQSKDLGRIDCGEYVAGLATQMYRACRADRRNIALRTDIERVLVGPDTAIYCGLIVNELISNALRHGFPRDRAGAVTVSVRAGSEGLIVRVADDGAGLPPGLDYRSTATLGLQLVAMLTEQLAGKLALDREAGTAFTLTLAGVEWTRPEDDAHA